jgi:hypothetical protein
MMIIVAVHGLKLEIGNWEKMKRVYELDVYRLAEELSKSNARGYKAIVEKLGPKLNTFINSTKA